MKLLATILLCLSSIISPKLVFGEPENNANSIPSDYRGTWESVGHDNFRHISENGCAMQIIIGQRSIKYIRSEDYRPETIVAPGIVGINVKKPRKSLLFGYSKPQLRIKYGSGFGAHWFRTYSSDWTLLQLEDTYLLSAVCAGCRSRQNYFKAK